MSLITIVPLEPSGDARVGSIDGSKIQESKQIWEEKGYMCQLYTVFYLSWYTHENKVMKIQSEPILDKQI